MKCAPLFLLAIASSLAAQDRPTPEEALRIKLAAAFLQKAKWTTDYDAARAEARARKTLIFGYFTTTGP